MNPIKYMMIYQSDKFYTIILTSIITAILVFILSSVFSYKRIKVLWRKCILVAILCGYIMGVLQLTFIQRVNTTYQINLNLFWSYREWVEGTEGVYYSILGNIILFIPMGILNTMMFGRKKGIFLGIVCSGCIECLQLVFKRGLFELDDIFNNTLGVIIGYCLYLFCMKIGTVRRKI